MTHDTDNPRPAAIERVAVRDLPTRCSRCGLRIDRDDRYRIIAWRGGFDWEHADCTIARFPGLREDAR